MYVKNYILFVGLFSLTLYACSCNTKRDGIWVSNDGKSILEINEDKWKIIYSTVSGLCTEMSLVKDLGSSGVLKIDSPKDMHAGSTTNYKIKANTLDVFDNLYSKENVPKWDSILIYKSANAESKMNLYSKYVSDSPINHELLVALIMEPQFDLIHPTNTSTDYLIKYEVWRKNQIIGSKEGGSNFLCVH